MASSFVSQAEFARHRGVSRFTVTHWKHRGLLVMRDGGLVDVVASEKLIDARPEKFRGGMTNRRPACSAKAAPEKTSRPSKIKAARKAKRCTATAAPAPIAPAVEAALANVLPEAALWTTAEATRRKEVALALTRQLEFDVKAGNVVEISKVVETVQAEYAVLRDRLLQLPGKISDRIAGVVNRHEVEKILRAEVYEALSALSARGGGMSTDERLRKALAEAAKLLRPPPAQNLIEWADLFRVVPSGTSATPGKWQTRARPAAYGPMAAISEGDTHTVTVMASTQTIKSELLLNTAGYFIAADPAAILLVQPTQGAAKSFAKERLGPTIEGTPCLKELVPTPRSRIGDATITHRSYPGGALDLVGANAPTDLSSRPKRIVLEDEIDKYPASAGSEGDPLKLAEERASTYKNIGRAKFVRTCSPTDTESRIAREYGFSDQRRLFVACPHCGHEQTLKWKHVKWDKGPAGDHLVETAGIECESCGVRWSERERREVMERLEFAPAYGWRQTSDFTCCNETQPAQQWDNEGRSTCMHCGSRSPYEGHAGFHVSKLYSIRHRLSDGVREFLEAKHSGDHELLRKFFNTALAVVFEPQLGEGIDGSALITRLENYRPDSVPAGVEVVTGFCDVQGDRLEIQFVGWAFNEEAFALDYVIINLDPGQGAAWRELDSMTLRTFRRCDGKTLPCSAFGIDAGGMHGSQVFDFARKRRGRRIFPTYGRAGKVPIWTSQAGRNKQNDPFWKIGVDSAKDAIYSRLKILPDPEGKPVAGCIHFPALPIFNAEYFAGLTAERRERRMRFGQPYTVYVCPPGKRNEPLDTMVGCLAVRRSVPAGQRSTLEYSVYGPRSETTTMTPRGLRPAGAPAPVHHGKITGRSLSPAPRRLMP